MQWAVGQQESEKYRNIFASVVGSHLGTMGPDEAKQLLERSRLPTPELVHIWRLSDVDRDGRLAPGEFLCAMAIASRRARGAPLPQTLPAEIAKIVERPVESAKLPQRAEAPAKEEAPTLAQTVSTTSAGGGGSEWEVAPGELEGYREYFRRLDKAGTGAVEPRLARQVLESSGLEIEDLARIWDLSDTGLAGDSGLALGEFICAMALVARRRNGLPLPSELPPELAQHVSGNRGDDHLTARA